MFVPAPKAPPTGPTRTANEWVPVKNCCVVALKDADAAPGEMSQSSVPPDSKSHLPHAGLVGVLHERGALVPTHW
jgi:hypothetical protein